MAGRNGLLVFRDAVLVSEFLSNEIVEFVFTDRLLKPRTNPNSCQMWLWMTQMVGGDRSGITALSPLENWPLRIVKCALNMYRPDRESERFPP